MSIKTAGIFEKVAIDGRDVGAGLTGGLPGFLGKRDKDKGKQNIGYWAGGAALLGGATGGAKGAAFMGASTAANYGIGRLWSEGKKKKKSMKKKAK